MSIEQWSNDSSDVSARRQVQERKLWLLAARILIPVNALIVGWLIGQAL